MKKKDPDVSCSGVATRGVVLTLSYREMVLDDRLVLQKCVIPRVYIDETVERQINRGGKSIAGVGWLIKMG